MTKPLSAFAARKAIRTTHASKTTFSEAHALAADDEISNSDTVPPHQKRRKRAANNEPFSEAIAENERGRRKIATAHTSSLRLSSDGSISEGSEERDDDLEAHNFASGQDAGMGGSDSHGKSPSSRDFTIQKLSSFSPCESNVLSESKTKWTVRMGRKDTLALVGEYDLWVKKGAVSMYGAILYASSKMHRVYAPSTHALPLIKPIHNPFGPEIQPVEITIASCGSRLRMLKQISPRFGRIWNSKPFSDESNITPIDCTKRSFVSMQSSAEDAYQRPLESLEPPADWQTIIMELLSRHSARNPAAVLVCGPKGAGKSTFCRMLGNALLTKPTKEAQPNLLLQDLIALLDLDPGQPEFSPPGDVSLSQLHSCNFGPPFTHPTVPPGNGSRLIRSHHVGHLSPKDDPSYYLTCAYDLINTYHGLLRSHPACPIVINCPGWVQGSGLELLAGLIKVLHPTKVVYLSLLGPEEVVDTLSKAASNAKTQLHQISSQPSQAVSRTASELRMMQTLSYFHLDEPEIGNLCWNSCPLIQRAPQVIHYTGPKQAILAVMILGEEQKPEFFESIFEGCVVGIVVIEDDSVIPVATAPSTHKESEQITYEELDSEGVEDSHMDSEVNDLRPNEFPEGLDNRVPSKGRDRNGGHSDPGYGAPLHLQHPSIQRTPTGIPYIPPTDHITTPFSPSHSHSLGQALIRSIDPNSKTIHLLTPIPPSTLQSLHREKRKIVLVRGKLDTPTWAYKEQLELEKTRRRRREQDLGVQEEWDEEAMREWARETPWAGVVEGGRKGSAKARRVRRDIKYRGQGGGGVSE